MNDAQTASNKAEAEVTVLKQKIDKASKANEKESKELARIEKDIIGAGAELGLIADTGLAVVELAGVRNRELSEAIDRMADFLVETQRLTAENTEKTNHVNAARKTFDEASKQYDKAKTARDKIVVDVESKNSELKSKRDTIDVYSSEIRATVPDADLTVLDKLKTEVNALAEAHRKAVSDCENIESDVSKLEKTVENISETLGNVDNVEVTDGPTYVQDEIFAHVGAYKTRVGVCNANKTAVDTELDTLTRQRTELLDSLIDMSNEDIENPGLGYDEAEIQQIAAENEKARKTASEAETALNAVVAQVDEHATKRPASDLDADGAVAALNLQTDAKTDVDRRLGAVDTELKTDKANRERHADVLEQIEKARTVFDAWAELDKYFGNDRFKRIVCSYILAELIERANYYMSKFRPRYTLIVNPGSLEILVHDRDMGVTRAFNTLSGGETFMTSLSLALGLASMNDVGFAADTIFIDEGFGTLSGDCLETVMDSLDRLNNVANRRVGIISHVESLRDRIPTRIDLKPNGTYSTVNVLGS